MRHALITLLLCGLLPAPARPQAAWTATPHLRIGSVDDSTYAFTSITSLAFAPGGEIVVADARENQIRIFSPDGGLLRRFGRQGDGPGEFQALARIGFVGDTLYAADWRQGRLTFFTAEGDVIRTESPVITLSTSSWMRPMVPTDLFGEGLALSSVSFRAEQIPSHMPYLVVRRSGAVVDTVMLVPMGSGQLTITSPGGGSLFGSQPFAQTAQWHFLPALRGGVLLEPESVGALKPGEFRLTRVSFRGDTAWSRVFRVPAQEITSAEADSAVAKLLEDLASAGLAEQEIRAAVKLPKHHAPATAVRLADDGRVWVRLHAPGAEAQWLIFSAAGDLAGRIRLPQRFRLQQVRSGIAWGSELDELDVPFLVAYRVAPQR